MPSHWTYDNFGRDDDLRQGDILRPTPDLQKIIENLSDSNALGLIVITQTCDLVRRSGGTCSARYINLAKIVDLRTYLPEIIRQVKGAFVRHNVYAKEKKDKIQELLERVFNQNESAQALFYLHPDVDAGISESSVAVLRSNLFALNDYYKDLVDARTGRLKIEFSNRLGWMVGNIFSRIGTRDWQDTEDDKAAFKKLLLRFLEPIESEEYSHHWVEYAKVKKLYNTNRFAKGLCTKQFIDRINEVKVESKLEKIAQKVVNIARGRFGDIRPEELEAYKDRILKDPLLKDLVR